jgi:hypothetical protein
MNEVTIFNEDWKTKWRTSYLETGNIRQTNEITGTNCGTFDGYYYLNKNGLRDFVTSVKRERMLQQAEQFSKTLMQKDAGDSAKLLAIQQKEAEFLRETQGKDLGYSKRIETIGFNVNKNEPLDDEQKTKLEKLLKKSGVRPVKEAEYVSTANDTDNAMCQDTNTPA